MEPLEIHTFYSLNEMEALQTLGKYAFASQYETDEFLQKISLIKKPDTTKTTRLPTLWLEKYGTTGNSTFYSVNGREALQTLGKYAFASQYETDEILQKNQPD